MNIKPIVEAVAASAGRKPDVQEAVNKILGEDITAGQTVAIIDDPVYGMSGAKGTVKSINSNNPGFCDVELVGGARMPMQTSLLVPV